MAMVEAILISTRGACYITTYLYSVKIRTIDYLIITNKRRVLKFAVVLVDTEPYP